jgi:hypothetical protein
MRAEAGTVLLHSSRKTWGPPPLTAWTATGGYLVLALILTWPVAARMATRLPNDLGDPLFSCWTMAWNLDHLLELFRGHAGALAGYWHAGIFYPEPLALAYSEHLFAPSVQVLPLYAITGNIVLCYNVLFLSTFVLSGLGVFLLARDLTGSARAAFVAGLFFAFAPYRATQLGHIQVLSSQWMPLALFGLNRWALALSAGRIVGEPKPVAARLGRNGVAALAGATAALVALNLSCGYYLVYFTPFVLGYAVWLLAARALWRVPRAWLMLAASATVVAAACTPFLLAYRRLRQLGFGPRPLEEIQHYSADTLSYLRAPDALWLWPGGFTSYIRSPEAHLFPGVTPLVLAIVGLACLALVLGRRTLDIPPLRGWRLAAAVCAAAIGVAALDLARFELFAGRLIWRVREAWPFLSDIRHVFLVAAGATGAVLALSARARRAARLALSSQRVFFTASFLLAVWLSFGPLVATAEHGIAADTLYAWLYRHVPGFDGLRVPARFAMLAQFFLAIVAGYGAAAIDRGVARPRLRWAGPGLAAAIGAFFLLESAAPVGVVALEWTRRDGRPGTVSVTDLDPVYGFVRRMPAGTIVVELPFGELQAETRAVFLSARHRHPIVNGYSGGFPPSYESRKRLLGDPLAHGDAAWQALLDSGATCVIVHEWAFDDGGGRAISGFLEANGARPLATFKADRLFEIPR